MSLDQVAIRIVNPVAAVAQVSPDGAQTCKDRQNNHEKLLHKNYISGIATICQLSVSISITNLVFSDGGRLNAAAQELPLRSKPNRSTRCAQSAGSAPEQAK